MQLEFRVMQAAFLEVYILATPATLPEAGLRLLNMPGTAHLLKS